METIYLTDKIDTMNKPFSVCWMVFGPEDNCNLIVGDTNEVKNYWESLDVSFDFQWYIFDMKNKWKKASSK